MKRQPVIQKILAKPSDLEYVKDSHESRKRQMSEKQMKRLELALHQGGCGKAQDAIGDKSMMMPGVYDILLQCCWGVNGHNYFAKLSGITYYNVQSTMEYYAAMKRSETSDTGYNVDKP